MMAKKLKQINPLIDHTGIYFQEEMGQIVSIPIYSSTLLFLPLSLIYSCFPILHIVLLFKSKLIKYLILQGISPHYLTPNESVVVLHAANVCLGWSISDAEIREENLTSVLTKEDFDVPAQISIYYSYLLDCCQFFNPLFP